MSWSDRRRLLGLLAAASLAGCNLRPMVGSASEPGMAAKLAAIDVRSNESELAQTLRLALEDALNPAGLSVPAAYDLALDAEQFQNSLAIQLDATVTRFDLTVLASFTLTERGEREPFYTSAARRTASYNVARQPYATLTAQRDARRRAAEDLAIDIRTRLALALAGRPAPAAA